MIEGDFQLFEGKWSIEQVHVADIMSLGTFCVNFVDYLSKFSQLFLTANIYISNAI